MVGNTGNWFGGDGGGGDGGGGGDVPPPEPPKDDPRISEYTGPQGNIRVVEDYTGQGGHKYTTVIGNVSGTPTPGYSGSGFQKMAGTTLRQPSAHADILASSQKSPALAGTLEKAGIIRIQNIPVQPQQAIMPASIQQVSNFRDSLQVSPTPSITEMRGRHDIEVGKLNTRQGEMRVGDIRSTRMFPVKQRMDNATMYVDDKISAWQGRAPEDVPYSVFGRNVAGGLAKGVAAVPGMAVDVVTGVEMIARDPSASLSGVPAGLGLMAGGIAGGLKENPTQTVSQLAGTALVLGAGAKVSSKVSLKNMEFRLAMEKARFKNILSDDGAQASLLLKRPQHRQQLSFQKQVQIEKPIEYGASTEIIFILPVMKTRSTNIFPAMGLVQQTREVQTQEQRTIPEQSVIQFQQTREVQQNTQEQKIISLLGSTSVRPTGQTTPQIIPQMQKQMQKQVQIARGGAGNQLPKRIIPRLRPQSTPPPRQNKRGVKQVSTDYRRSEREAPLLNPKKLLGGTGNTKLCELMGTCAPKRKVSTKMTTTTKRRKVKK